MEDRELSLGGGQGTNPNSKGARSLPHWEEARVWFKGGEVLCPMYHSQIGMAQANLDLPCYRIVIIRVRFRTL